MTTLFTRLNVQAGPTVILEDALGYHLRIPLEVVKSWNVRYSCRVSVWLSILTRQTVDSIIHDQFQNRPGWNLVKDRRYIIQDCQTGKIMRQDILFTHAVRPGQKLLMAMVFYQQLEPDNICPRCKTITVAGSSVDVVWYATGKVFQFD